MTRTEPFKAELCDPEGRSLLLVAAVLCGMALTAALLAGLWAGSKTDKRQPDERTLDDARMTTLIAWERMASPSMDPMPE